MSAKPAPKKDKGKSNLKRGGQRSAYRRIATQQLDQMPPLRGLVLGYRTTPSKGELAVA
jgi:hypothetical protein